MGRTGLIGQGWGHCLPVASVLANRFTVMILSEKRLNLFSDSSRDCVFKRVKFSEHLKTAVSQDGPEDEPKEPTERSLRE